MNSFPPDDRSPFRQAARYVVVAFAALVLTPFLQTPATKLAEKLNFDRYFADRWEPLVTRLSDITHNLWYVLFAGVVVGVAGGLWTALLFPERKSNFPKTEALKNRVSQIEPSAVSSSLRLEFAGGRRMPRQIRAENILHWFALWPPDISFTEQMEDGSFGNRHEFPGAWIIVLFFDQPVRISQLIVQPSVESFPTTEARFVTANLAIVTTFGDDPPTRCILDIYTT